MVSSRIVTHQENWQHDVHARLKCAACPTETHCHRLIGKRIPAKGKSNLFLVELSQWDLPKSVSTVQFENSDCPLETMQSIVDPRLGKVVFTVISFDFQKSATTRHFSSFFITKRHGNYHVYFVNFLVNISSTSWSKCFPCRKYRIDLVAIGGWSPVQTANSTTVVCLRGRLAVGVTPTLRLGIRSSGANIRLASLEVFITD